MHTLISLFSGIGGLDLAAHWAGFQTVHFVESDSFCQKVLAEHWPDVPIDSDVCTSHPPKADVICGGFPCQPFSLSGQMAGRNDERYLLPEMLRIAKEVEPYAILFENVPGFSAINDGAEFKLLLRQLTEMGFDAEWGHIRASTFGAPHRRERWFLVAYTQRFRCAGRGQHTDGTQSIEQSKESIRAWDSTETQRRDSSLQRERAGEPQSRVGRNVNGLPSRVDCARWPANMGNVQYEYEPKRTTQQSTYRKDRIRTLGNAVVPAMAYPLFLSIAEFLSEVKANQHE